ncbi:MAG: carbohydrate-binding domain-containing protein, partial [Oscillospiraceae bacterium]|nr:carbohydrate-binding domain-containing protein [Oscillospiraceae bacterium]
MTKTAKIILISVLSLVMAVLVFLCIRLGKSPEDIQNELSEETDTPTFSAEQALDTAQRLAAQAEISCSDGSANLIALSDASGTVTVSAPGVYLVEGSLSDGQLIVDCTGEVILILNSAKIYNSEDAAISVVSAEHVLIYLPEGSESRLVSGTSQEITPASENETVKSASGAALYAKDCLSIAGRGTLTAEGYINNGIATTDHLVVLGGKLDISAVNNGLKGKDSVTVLDGEITIEAGNDGIKSNNDTDSDCGNIDIRGGRITVTSLGDGIQAERDLSIADGTVTVISGGGSGEASGANSFDIPNGNFPADFGGQTDITLQQPPEMTDGDMQLPELPDGDIQPPEMPDGDFRPSGMPDGNMQPPEMPDGDTNMQKPQTDFSRPDDTNRDGNGMSFPDGFDRDQIIGTDSGGSTKGLKCGQQLTVSGGTITVNSLDDSIHSNGTVSISGGTLSLASGDDGIHADDTLTIDGGSITVTQAYEGLEAHLIFI